MELSEIEAGSKLELELIDESGDRIEPILISKFERSREEDEAVIAAPIFEGNIVPLRYNTLMNVYFTKIVRNVVNLFKFQATVKGREVTDNLQYIIIEKNSEVVKIQRREYYRLDCILDVYYRVVEAEMETSNKDSGKEKPFTRALANNLSGGGISLLLEEKIEVGKTVECEIFSERGKKIRFFGKVVRYERNENSEVYRFKAGIAYVKINENDRDDVVRHIYEQQRKLRNKGMI